MDSEEQEKDFIEEFEKLALESEPDGYNIFKKTLKAFTGRKSKHRKDKDEPIAKSDEISPDRTPKHGHPREPHQLQEISESPWVYPQSSSRSDDPALPDDDRYLFQHKKRGFAVLIINSEFDYQSERGNADWDRYYMSKMFQQLDFTVILLENLTSRKLLEKMIDIQQRITPETDCFACVISSHGMEGQAKVRGHGTREPYVRTEHFIHTKDGVVRTTELLELFNDRYCRNLRGKPRMFFIQACRGRLDVQKDDEVDMGVEVPVQLVTPPASSSSSRDPLRPATTGDVGGSYDEYQFRKQAAWSTDHIYENFRFNKKVNYHVSGQTQSGYQVHVQASVKGEERKEPPPRTTTYKVPNPEPEPEPEKIEIFQIPCFNDYLVMFSSAAGTIAWSDTGKGGWLMYCLYHVFHDVTYTEDDLLTILTQVCGKMAISMETYCPSTPRFDKAKSAACVYHRLSKDIYLQPN
ncbi:caspase-1-like [Crassostrea virginica]